MDRLIEKAGSFGRFQKLILIVIGMTGVLSGLAAFISIFNNAIPKLLCKHKSNGSSINEGYINEDVCKILKNITLENQNERDSLFECQSDTSIVFYLNKLQRLFQIIMFEI